MSARNSSGAIRHAFLLFAVLLAEGPGPASAEAGWLESGDPSLRADLQLLSDAEVIRYPLNQWPIPRDGIRYALANAKDHFATNAAVMAALTRVRARLGEKSARAFSMHAEASAGEAGMLRDFDSVSRENRAIGGGFEFDSGRFSVGVDLAAVPSPSDGQSVRADGSHATMRLGNWLLSANTLERWWGPGHESSLILSNNARPMPTVLVERVEARPFESKLLSWLGPWRFNFGISRMESERHDIDSPLFMAWRVSIMPFRDIELGFSRTAQFCGDQLECSWDVFWNLIAGNDNVGIDATPENEPGNQMAGFDIRWASPIGSWPYAIYGQYIGEDESSYLPAKYLGQLGFETWKPFADGSLLQFHAEYANTTCSALSRSEPYVDCAYNQGRFNAEGYRYRGRVIGHTTDSDAETYEVGASFTGQDGSLWSLTGRASRLNNDGYDPFETRNTVSAVPAKYAALELGWRGKWLGQALSVELGAESLQPEGGERDVEPYGFIGWRHDFRP